MDRNRIETVYRWLVNVANTPNCTTVWFAQQDIQNIKNGIIKISHDIETDNPFLSQELFTLKDRLFVGYGSVNPFVIGQVLEILKVLRQPENSPKSDLWNLLHPQIVAVSKSLFETGHYANAACDAFIEINDRVKRLYAKLRPGERVPDGDAAMKTVFSSNSPLIEFCDRSNDSGANTQKGFMEMLGGAMSALRNPKAHANITITAEDAIRRLIFASMLMYKIDEAVRYSKVSE